MDLNRIISEYSLDMVPIEGIPKIAEQALEAGYDSTSLRQLAGLDSNDSATIKKTFHKSLEELHVCIPSQTEAALSIARYISKDIVEGSIAPYEGATKIWHDLYSKIPSLIQLRPFVGYASEFEDDPSHREEYAKLIVQEAMLFLQKA